jgi:hypothetical protein
MGLEQSLAQRDVDGRGGRGGERALKGDKHLVAIDLFNGRLKTPSCLVQQDNTLTRSHSQDSGDMFGFCTGYGKGALALDDLVNEKTTHKEVPKVEKIVTDDE